MLKREPLEGVSTFGEIFANDAPGRLQEYENSHIDGLAPSHDASDRTNELWRPSLDRHQDRPASTAAGRLRSATTPRTRIPLGRRLLVSRGTPLEVVSSFVDSCTRYGRTVGGS